VPRALFAFTSFFKNNAFSCLFWSKFRYKNVFLNDCKVLMHLQGPAPRTVCTTCPCCATSYIYERFGSQLVPLSILEWYNNLQSHVARGGATGGLGGTIPQSSQGLFLQIV